MHRLAETCERIAATTKKLEKTAIVAEYLKSCPAEEAAISAVFLSGRAFPAWEETTLQVGGRSLWQIVAELSGKTDEELEAAYRKRGDLGAVAGDVLPEGAKSDLRVAEVENAFRKIASARGSAAKSALVRELLTRVTPPEAKYIVKIMTGDLRIGLKESLVEEAIAKAFVECPSAPEAVTTGQEPLAAVQRANMLLGDIGATLQLAAGHRLHEARMRLFHPIGFMLASPAADANEAFEYFEHALVEDKYDGIRAQAHCGSGQVRLFSRTLDEVTQSFPELVEPLSEFTGEVVLDGEIVAWREGEGGNQTSPNDETETGHAMPFSEIQKRLGRKQVSRKLIAEVPVAYVVFDLIYAEGELMLDKPLAQRAQFLDRVFAGADRVSPRPVVNAQGNLLFEPEIKEEAAISGWVLRAPAMRADSSEQLQQYFEQAMARGNEGLMIKDINSPYMPGRRGRWWLKLKRELATLDVVVTAAEFGHGKRIHVLSDYTFAVRKGEELVNIGKAYSGLTDKEIAELTEWFLAHTTADHGHLREVEPKIVLEVAFNAIMRSDRHDSGYALRFPRIVRVREDKLPKDIDTVEAVERIYKRQHGR